MAADRPCLPGLLAASLPRLVTKNLLVPTAPQFAFPFGADVWLTDFGAPVVLCLISCATYLLHGCRDMAADRAHEPLVEFQLGEPGIKLTLAGRLSATTVIGLPSWAG
jgi:hypothetical protein